MNKAQKLFKASTNNYLKYIQLVKRILYNSLNETDDKII